MAIAKPAARTAARPAARPAVVAKKTALAPAVAQAAGAGGFMSFDPNTFTAGGLIDDIDATITDAAAVTFDFNGNAPANTPAAAIEYTDANGATHTQYYSMGKPEDWQPAEDGVHFVPVSGKSGLNMSTNFGMWLQSMIEAGFPTDQLGDGDISVFVGSKVHVFQKQLERKGLIRTGKNADRPPSVLLVSKIYELPSGEAVGEQTGAGQAAPAPTSKAAVGGKANGQAKPVAAKAQAAAQASDLDSEITGVLMGALSEAENNTLAKKDVAKAVYAGFEDAKVRSKAVVRCGQQDFLAGLAESGIAYDGSSISLVTE